MNLRGKDWLEKGSSACENKSEYSDLLPKELTVIMILKSICRSTGVLPKMEQKKGHYSLALTCSRVFTQILDSEDLDRGSQSITSTLTGQQFLIQAFRDRAYRQYHPLGTYILDH